jgi:LuxR family maltose regulon positive regulatory protein
MDQPLLQTKFLIPPSRPKRIPRPRLLDRLNAGLHRKLTLASAPAGFGKTTLISEWVRALACAKGWITVQEEDNDPARFLACLETVLCTAASSPAGDQHSSGREAALRLSFAGRRSAAEEPDAVLILRLNEMAASGILRIAVLDDYHPIEESAVHRMTDFLIEHAPPFFHLVICTRAEPPIALPRLRARDEVNEIGPELLRLSFPEAECFLNRVMELNLSPEEVGILEQRSEGWITGLQLAALSLRQTHDRASFLAGFAGDSRPVAEYLSYEILDCQPEDVRNFLLRTSFLRRLHPDLCSAVLEGGWNTVRCREVLEHLESDNLFTSALDSRRPWFQYHSLFAEYLRGRARREIPDMERELHRRAGRWLAEAGDLEEAMHHVLAIPDFDQALHLLEQYGLRLLQEGRIDAMRGWVKQLPGEKICGNPHLALGAGWISLLRGDLAAAEGYLLAGEQAVQSYRPKYIAQEDREVPPEEVRGDLATLRAFLCQARGDAAGMMEAARRAREWIPHEGGENRQILEFNVGLMLLCQGRFAEARESLARAAVHPTANRFVAVSAQSCEGDAWLHQGKAVEAESCYRKAIAMGQGGSESSPAIPSVFMGICGLAQLALLRCDFPAANGYLDSSMDLAFQYGDPRSLAQILRLRIQSALTEGDWNRAEDELKKAATAQAAGDNPPLSAILQGYLDLARGDLDGASGRLETMDLSKSPDTSDPLWMDRWPAHLLSIRIDLARRRIGKAMDALQQLKPRLEQFPSAIMTIEWHLLQAMAWSLRKDMPQAFHALRTALALADPAGFLQPFLNLRPGLDPLLRTAMAQGVHPDFVHRTLSLRENDFAQEAGLLTPRERQILRLLAEGLTSTEAARRLVITAGTARSYIKEIYRKLDAHSRKEALDAARKRGLL